MELERAGVRFDFLRNEEHKMLATQRPVDHPLPVTGKPFIADALDIIIVRLGGFIAIVDEFLLIIGIAGPLELGALVRPERGEENANFLLKLI
jgi:hypothetical protein